MDGEKATETTDTGTAKVKVEKIPTEETILKIKLSGSGMNDFTKVLNVKLEKGSASDLKVFFKSEDGDQEVVGGITPTFSTTKTEGTVTVKTTSAEMSKVMVGGAEATLSEDKKSATYKLSVTGTDTDPQEVKVEVEFPYFKKAERTFKVAKYGNKNDFPLQLVSAKILSGDKGENTTVLDFDASNKASVEIGDVRFSVVTLAMEFDQPLKSRTVLECKDERSADYSTKPLIADVNGIYSGYITTDIDITKNNAETPIQQISGKKYMELLIVGFGTVSYKIEVTSNTDKKKTYTVEIKNTNENIPKPNADAFFQEFGTFNGNSGRPTIYTLGRTINLPNYSKGSMFNGQDLNLNGFSDLAYMDNMALVMIQFQKQPFCWYYNIMEENGGKPNNKHEFKRMWAGYTNNGRALVRQNISELNGKYIDMFISNEKNTPYPMFPLYYGQKWRKTSPKHGFLIKLSNTLNTATWPGVFKDNLSADFVFDLIFNYRIQSIVYDNLNKTGSTEPNELVIAKKQKFSFWETGTDIQTWIPFLSGKSEAKDKDVFKFTPIFADKNLIKTVKYTIKCGDEETSCVEDSKFKDFTAKVNKDGDYILGSEDGNAASYTFNDGKIYKIEVKVEYTDSTTDKFNYMIDYKNEKTLNLMDIAGEQGDFDSNLFGVPTSYGMKTIDPAILKELANNSYTFIQGM